jgi:hypothetical protein
VFEGVFEKVFALCVEKGMVSGETQCIDSALIKANASLDSLLEKQPTQDSPSTFVMHWHTKLLGVRSKSLRQTPRKQRGFSGIGYDQISELSSH